MFGEWFKRPTAPLSLQTPDAQRNVVTIKMTYFRNPFHRDQLSKENIFDNKPQTEWIPLQRDSVGPLLTIDVFFSYSNTGSIFSSSENTNNNENWRTRIAYAMLF